MQRRTFMATGFAGCLAAFPRLAQSDEAAWTSLDILDGRLSVQAPPDAVRREAPHSIMAAAPSDEVSSRVFFRFGTQTLVAMPTETFLTTTKPLEAYALALARRAQSMSGAPNISHTVLRGSGELSVLLLKPDKPVKVGGAVFLADSMIQRRDGALIELPFFGSDPEMLEDEKLESVIDRLLRSANEGPRALRTGNGVSVGRPTITMNLPAGFTAYSDNGPDFSVYHVLQVVEPGERQATMGLYLGSHPTQPHAPEAAAHRRAEALGKAADWREWNDETGQFRCEAFVQDVGAGLAHLFIAAPDKQRRDLLYQVASSLQLKA